MNTPMVAIASDHAGFDLKQALKNDITALGFKAQDLGPHSTESVDYPDYANKLVEWMKAHSPSPLEGEGWGEGVSSEKTFNEEAPSPNPSLKGRGKVFGVLVCGSGIGMSIAANRHAFIRAALVHNGEEAALARKHNDANVLCLGARTTSAQNAQAAIKVFLTTEFEGGRHSKRVEKLGVKNA